MITLTKTQIIYADASNSLNRSHVLDPRAQNLVFGEGVADDTNFDVAADMCDYIELKQAGFLAARGMPDCGSVDRLSASEHRST